MRVRALPEAARLAESEDVVAARFGAIFDLEDAIVLEIGGALPEASIPGAPRAWWSVDPRNIEEKSPLVQRLRGSATDIPREANSVDLVFSSNAFQHVHPLEVCLKECARVLRPGGLLYANFGPIWTGPDGSHVEDLLIDGDRHDFWTHSLVPDWAHLVLPDDELSKLLTAIHGAKIGMAVAEYVRSSTWLNRIGLGALRRAIDEAGLSILFLDGCERFGYEHRPPAIPKPWREALTTDAVEAFARTRLGLAPHELRWRDIELVLRA